MNQLHQLLIDHHGVISTGHLTRAGLTKHAIAQAVSKGILLRMRKGMYCAIDRPLSQLSIARMAGSNLTCISALEHYGLWIPKRAEGAHFRMSRKRMADWAASTVRKQFAPLSVAHVAHAAPPPSGAIDSAAVAILTSAQCLERDDLVATIESTMRRGMTYEQALAIGPHGNARLREALRLVDPELKSESGLETLVRLRLAARRLAVRQQAWVCGWPVDFLIGDRLIIEVDGFAYHSSPADYERDRRKDRTLHANGYIVLRFTSRDIMERWEACEREILEFVKLRKHRW